ncbi:expressed protein [Echinococcus multilocularis]|uniref:Expressed protein n=1 Tax=Echinococcus multilocularis TaxID=6211 RepID=A0A068YLG1_ECHMU|nr:expressed protein [Echinococcus multilocularis]
MLHLVYFERCLKDNKLEIGTWCYSIPLSGEAALLPFFPISFHNCMNVSNKAAAPRTSILGCFLLCQRSKLRFLQILTNPSRDVFSRAPRCFSGGRLLA